MKMQGLVKKMASISLSFMMGLSLIQAYAPMTAEAATPIGIGNDSIFGPNVYVFEPSDSAADIQATIDSIYSIQETNQFGSERFAVLFKPGTYDNVRMKMGFYTQAAGLGLNPGDTTINEFDCNADWMGANATCNFWRSAENLRVKKTVTWAAAQATSLRHMQFDEWLALDQWGQGWASGGYIADSVVKDTAAAWSEQQYISRNCDFGSWAGGVWNAVFVGMKSGLKEQGTENPVVSNWSDPGRDYQYYTNVENSPVIRETPYLTIDSNGNYSVYVPSLRTNANNVSWANGTTPGTSISIDQFFIARPSDSVDTINAQLANGKHLILTPGNYNLNKAIQVNNANTIVLGLGYPTLNPTGMNACMEVADVDGVTVSGMLFDAGPQYTETLLKVGPSGAAAGHASNPTLLSDLFFRVGGAASGVTQSKTCIIINSKNVIGDNFWVWRADHGDGVAWDLNKTENGIVINGDNVTMYGLFVEHFHEYQTVWNGNNGKLFFYQSEIPYDVPNQASWKSHDGTVDGYASYKVGDNVTNHEAYGLGIYSFHRDATINLENAIEVPDVTGISIQNACTVMLAGNPGISHVINGLGDAVTIAGQRQQVVSFIGSGTGTVTPPVEPTTTNLALGKTTYSSSNLGGNTAASAVDGDLGTRWESEHADNQWMYIDLGNAYDVSGVRLAWEAAAGKDYTIDVSGDASNWTTVYQKTNGNGGTENISFNTVNARYVRMNGATRTTGYGFSLWEFEVFGGNSGNGSSATTVRVEAEDYTSMQGVETENCGDVGGGRNVGWIDSGDWMEYSVNVPATGNYKMDLRVNGWNTDASVSVAANNTALTSANVYTNTTWSTVTTGNFHLNQGTVTLRLAVSNGGFNLNWLELVPVN